MRFERLNPGEVLAAVGALTLFGLMWAVWFEHPTAADIPAEAIGFETTPDAWHAFAVTDIVLLAAVLCPLSAALLSASASPRRLPLDASAVVAIVGAVAALLIAYRIAAPIEIDDVTYRRDLPLFLAFGASGLIVLGGMLSLRMKGTSLAAQLRRAASGESRAGDSRSRQRD